MERTLRYFKNDGIIIRYDKIAVKTQYYASKSDYGTFEQRKKSMKEAAHKLLKEFPEYGEILIKKTGMTEFKLYPVPKLKITQKNKTKSVKKKTKSVKKKTNKNKN